jgi:hypothetical protein
VISWVTWAALTGERLTSKPIPSGASFGQPFNLAAGQVMFLGSWFADRHIGFGINTFTIASHRITEDQALTAFQAAYPGFAALPVRCLICTP